ncbi:CBP4 [Emericellopsis cladophorae]|uniref:Cytochrome b mRNA-processing protein 4 n=1 Tax=Emericellopsis cladophorae TaxID=2686198 RepID=A0A9P9XYP3_9HYPO|nr:CBP4 [Emericellopsis cladophorae]KAI6780061.1 CBP4 [Emericellopsis cladophorae]
MGKKPTNWRLWGKVAVVAIVAVGGPAFTAWLSPSEEEIRAKYNPDLRRRSIEGKAQREQEFDEFVTRLKEYSKSDKPIWIVVKEEEERMKKKAIADAKTREREAEARKAEMRREALHPTPAEQPKSSSWFSWGGK